MYPFGAPGQQRSRGPSTRSRENQRGAVTPTTSPDSANTFDDDDYPAYTMGRAAEMTGTTPGFLRALGEHRLITPLRSDGGHRRYSRYQLRLAMRARDLVNQGTAIEAACRIVILEDQLEEALRINEQLRRASSEQDPTTGA
ncbi:MerR family transcriptional regulator [Streptacidiphilus pinicola]|uniref:MerR family transcriptional regulator n=1 Tax=Streptacidiphilus pinicola TaxID=2219663 RepID=A0A2X0KGE4_9ACTN|nr:MerR family transcriptional regulator [Streptacidiphilus pinicola]